MRVFLYGTLLDPHVFRRTAGTLRPFRRAVPARLPGFRRVAVRGTPYPTLLRGEGDVNGIVVALPPAPLARLKSYEGASYRLTPVQVLTRRGASRAHAWTTAPWRADPRRPWPRRDPHAGM